MAAAVAVAAVAAVVAATAVVAAAVAVVVTIAVMLAELWMVMLVTMANIMRLYMVVFVRTIWSLAFLRGRIQWLTCNQNMPQLVTI
jgi:hypothetical protein